MSKLETYLQEVKARLDAATPGKWEYNPPKYDGDRHSFSIFDSEDTGYSYVLDEGDAKFIAAAKTDVGVLLDLVEELLNQNDFMSSLLLEKYICFRSKMCG